MNSKIIYITLIFLLLGLAGYSQEYTIDQITAPITTCNATLYDSGGPDGNYSASENYTVTFCGGDGVPNMVVDVVELRTESVSFDYLKIYDGSGTGGTLLATLGGSSLPPDEIETTSNCVTIQWHSDGSVQYAGFRLDIRCGFPCQDYTVTITPDAEYDATEDAFLGCSGGLVSASVVFLHNNESYEQTIDNTNFSWTALNSNGTQVFAGLGLNELTEPLAPGAYFYTLTTTDINRCQVVSNTVTVYISVPPTFEGTTITSEVCPGEDVELIGVVNPPPEWQMTIQEVNYEQHCFDDAHEDQEQVSCFYYTEFAPGQTIQSADQIESIGMRMEHSYMGDLDILIQCPNGNRVTLFHQACSGGYFGEAVDYDDVGVNSCLDGDQWVGVGYDYYWTMSNNRGLMSANCPNYSNPLPSGNYQPVDNFSNLVGCPINGEWCVIFIDYLGADDGTVFQTELHFAEGLIPDTSNVISFQNTYGDEMQWGGDAVQTDGNSANNIANPTTPGQVAYTFSATDNFGCTYDTTVYVTVRDFTDPTCCIEPTPTIASIPDLICSNRTNLSAQNVPNGNTGEWTVSSYPNGDDVNNSVTFTNPNAPNTQVIVNGWGTYTFRWTEHYIGRDDCNGFAEITTTFRQQPTNSFVYTPIPCFGGECEVTYTGNMDSNADYTWTFGGAFVQGNPNSMGPFILTWQEAGTHGVTLTVDNDGCVTNDTLVSILNPERLVIDSISVVNDPCYHSNGGSAIVTHHGGTMPITYSWAAPGIELLNVGAGSYTLTITDANGCVAQAPFVITEPTEVVVQTIESQNLTCYASHDGSISVYAGGGTGDLHYLWSDVGDGPENRINLSAGEYYLTVSDDNNCGTTAYVALSQPEQLLIQMTTDYAVCEGEPTPVRVNAFGGTSPYHYIWNNGNGEFEAGTEISTLLTETTHYTAYVRDSHGCVSDMQTMTVTVSPQMVIDSIMLRQIKCYGHCDGRAELAMRGGLPPLQYSWPSDTYIYDGICSGAYTVTVADLIGCSVVGSFVITQPDDFVISRSMDSVSCHGGNDGEARIFVDGATPPYTYLWPNGNTTDILTASAGSYIVTVLDSYGCRYTEEFNIPEPTAMMALPMNNVTICNGQSAILTTQVTGGTPYYDYRWSGPDSATYNGIRYEVSPTVTSTYRLTIYDSHGCSIEMSPVTVKLNPDLRIASVVTSYDTICPGDEALIYVEADGGNGGPYTLTLQDGRVVPSPFTVTPDTTTMFYITLTDMCGTPSVTDSIEIFVHSFPDELFTTSNVEGCVPLTVTFSPLNINGTQYLWNFGDNDFSETEIPTHTYRNPGDFDVTMSVWSDFGCKIDKTYADIIHAYPVPKALFDADVQTVSVLSAEVLFNNRSIDANRYFWFFGDQDSSTYESPRHVYPEMGEYEVMLVAQNEHYCTDTTTRTITVYSQFSFYAPTSFTPNGDGLNDCFRICGNGISRNNFLLTIYDRWGESVFTTTDYFPAASCDACSEGAWDGTDMGSKRKGDKVLENGIYYWYCQFEDVYGIQHREQGTINLVR
jgi:gliding motility-associated-like protein